MYLFTKVFYSNYHKKFSQEYSTYKVVEDNGECRKTNEFYIVLNNNDIYYYCMGNDFFHEKNMEFPWETLKCIFILTNQTIKSVLLSHNYFIDYIRK